MRVPRHAPLYRHLKKPQRKQSITVTTFFFVKITSAESIIIIIPMESKHPPSRALIGLLQFSYLFFSSFVYMSGSVNTCRRKYRCRYRHVYPRSKNMSGSTSWGKRITPILCNAEWVKYTYLFFILFYFIFRCKMMVIMEGVAEEAEKKKIPLYSKEK